MQSGTNCPLKFDSEFPLVEHLHPLRFPGYAWADYRAQINGCSSNHADFNVQY